MRAVNGYLENGHFMPLEVIAFSKRVPAVLIYNEVVEDNDRAARMVWLRRFHTAIKAAEGEEMPDFPRAKLNRERIDFSDEG